MQYVRYIVITSILSFIGLLLFSDQGSFGKYISKFVSLTSFVKNKEPANPISEIERIAKLIIEDQKWNSSRINLFVYHWRSLDNLHQRQARDSEWYSQFTTQLRGKIKRLKSRDSSQSTDSDENMDLIFTLAVVVGVTQENENFNDLTNLEPKSTDTSINAQVNDLHRQIEELNRRAVIARDRSASSETDNPFEAPFGDDDVKKKQSLRIAKIDEQPNLRNPKASRLSSTDSKTKFKSELAVRKIKETDINDILDRYLFAYERGDTDGLIELFVKQGTSSEKRKINQLKSNFVGQFNSSNDRFIEFSDLSWQIDTDKALGRGYYFAINVLKNRKGTRTYDGKVNFELKWEAGQVRIANFQLIDLKVKMKVPEKSLSSTKKPSKNQKPVRSKSIPTTVELDAVVNRFVGAYEEGDIGTLESLFSFDEKTNKNNVLQRIKNNFSAEFANTTNRQMFIQDLRWSFESDYAKGVGNIKYLVSLINGNKVESNSGKIELIAKKINDKVYITHLYRTEDKIYLIPEVAIKKRKQGIGGRHTEIEKVEAAKIKKGETRFEADPCRSNIARFLSTCRK